MPLYTIKCHDHGHKNAIWRKVAERDNLPTCDQCNSAVSRIIEAPSLAPDIQPYISPATGRVISSRSAAQYDLESTGHILNEPGIREDIARNKKRTMDRSFEPIAHAVDQKVAELVSRNQIES